MVRPPGPVLDVLTGVEDRPGPGLMHGDSTHNDVLLSEVRALLPHTGVVRHQARLRLFNAKPTSSLRHSESLDILIRLPRGYRILLTRAIKRLNDGAQFGS